MPPYGGYTTEHKAKDLALAKQFNLLKTTKTNPKILTIDDASKIKPNADAIRAAKNLGYQAVVIYWTGRVLSIAPDYSSPKSHELIAPQKLNAATP